MATPTDETPHPAGDECVLCGLRGWSEGQHKVTADGAQITVAEGYGEYAGYSLVADGWHPDPSHSIPHGSFRSKEIARRVIASGELTLREP